MSKSKKGFNGELNFRIITMIVLMFVIVIWSMLSFLDPPTELVKEAEYVPITIAMNQQVNAGVIKVPGRVHLGIDGRNVNKVIAARIELGTDTGVQVTQVMQNSPAQRAGLKNKDVIVSADNIKVDTVADISKVLNEKNNGDRVKLRILREGNPRNINVILKNRGARVGRGERQNQIENRRENRAQNRGVRQVNVDPIRNRGRIERQNQIENRRENRRGNQGVRQINVDPPRNRGRVRGRNNNEIENRGPQLINRDTRLKQIAANGIPPIKLSDVITHPNYGQNCVMCHQILGPKNKAPLPGGPILRSAHLVHPFWGDCKVCHTLESSLGQAVGFMNWGKSQPFIEIMKQAMAGK